MRDHLLEKEVHDLSLGDCTTSHYHLKKYIEVSFTVVTCEIDHF